MGIKKRAPEPPATRITKTEPQDQRLRFSFEFFDATDVEMCPAGFPDGYVQTLMERLQALSQWRLSEFQSQKGKSIRAHTHNWEKTTRPDGFGHLNEQHREYAGWQFCLSANKYGRVHGIMIDNIYYVIWLDLNHALYP